MSNKLSRRTFISNLGIGVAASVAAPSSLVLSANEAEASVAVTQGQLTNRLKRVENVRTRALNRTLKKKPPKPA